MFRLVILSCWFLAKLADSKSLPRPSQEKILGGHDTEITKVPYHVAVRQNGSYACGGCIIGSKYILTAAHCVVGTNSTVFSIRAGSNYYNREGQRINVSEVIPHPNYNATTVDYDAAVLVLKDPLMLSEKVKVVQLAETTPRRGEEVLISGWGSTGDIYAANFLQSVSLLVVPKSTCRKKFGQAITKQMFCTGHSGGGKDSCDGDSGGPAVVKGKLAGIVSWGEDCGPEKTNSVYTSIASIRNWITELIKE